MYASNALAQFHVCRSSLPYTAVANSIRETLVVAVRVGYMFFIYNFVCFTVFHVDFSLCYWLLRCFFYFFYFPFEFVSLMLFHFFSFCAFSAFSSSSSLFVCRDSWHIRAAVCALTWASRQSTLLAAVPKVRPVHNLVADGSERVYITGQNHQLKFLKFSFLFPWKAANDGIYTHVPRYRLKWLNKLPNPKRI